MKQTVGFSQFVDAFHAHERFEQFGYHALKALFEHIEDCERDTGEELELDVIALCCDFTTFKTALEAAREYAFEPDYSLDDAAREDDALQWLQGETTVLPYAGGFVVQSF